MAPHHHQDGTRQRVASDRGHRKVVAGVGCRVLGLALSGLSARLRRCQRPLPSEESGRFASDSAPLLNSVCGRSECPLRLEPSRHDVRSTPLDGRPVTSQPMSMDSRGGVNGQRVEMVAGVVTLRSMQVPILSNTKADWMTADGTPLTSCCCRRRRRPQKIRAIAAFDVDRLRVCTGPMWWGPSTGF